MSLLEHLPPAAPTAAPVQVRTRPAAPAPRLLAAVEGLEPGQDRPADRALAHHRTTYAAPPAPASPRADLVHLVEQAGLRGRGGAAFPTSKKLAAVIESARTTGHRPIVVVNGTEGEPLSHKDDVLLSRAPNLVLDGAGWAAAAVGADEVRIAVDRERSHALLALDGSLRDRRAAGEAGVRVHLSPTPNRYVVGEETALVSYLNGGLAKPPGHGPKPFQAGVDGRPTLVLNVETACHLAQILQFGPDRFRETGTDLHAGTALATIGGAVAHPGVVEAPLGTRLADLARLAGGTTARPRGVLVGGYYGAWLDARACAGLGWSDEELTPWGGRVGCGSVAFLPEDTCAVREVARVLTWMAGQSAGQCGPCVHGLASIAAGFDQLAEGTAGPDTVQWLHRWAGQVEGRGACRFPDGAVRFLRTALDVFADDVEQHRLGHACAPPADGRYWLPIPDNGSEPWQ